MVRAYEEKVYWNSRQEPNSSRAREKFLLDSNVSYISDHIEETDKILDFGPGIGRTLSAYRPSMSITALDISSLYKDRLFVQAEKYGLDISFVLVSGVGDIPFSGKSFDNAVVVEVLLHQRPENINRVVEELVRVSDKVIVINSIVPPDGASHNFPHDIKGICHLHGWKIFDFKIQDNQEYFCIEEPE